MPQRRIIKASDLSGLSIYQDPKRGTIFYDFFTKRAFILTSRDVKTYTIYTSMLPLCIIVAFGASSLFSFNYITTIAIFIALFLFVAIAFRVMYFYKLPEVSNWHPVKRESIFVYLARNFSNSRLILLTLMLIALSILMPLYAHNEHMSGINLYSSYAIALITIIGSIISIIAIIIKNKNNY